MKEWRATSSLSRALVVGVFGVGAAVLFGEPVLVVLTAPFVLAGALGLVHRPTAAPRVSTRLDHVALHEGQGTLSRLVLLEGDDVEHVTRVAAASAYVAMHPADGQVGRLLGEGPPDLELSPRRWGRRMLGEEKVGLHTRWAGYRWGPVSVGGQEMRVLPVTAPFDSRAEAPQPLGVVGVHRSRRLGDGSEFAGIRPFQVGDRLRRINWRVSLRADALHVETTRAEEDSGVLLVVDALADHGRSGGAEGAASSLDLTVRAAAAIAEHHVRNGDRVSLRVVGRGGERVGYGSGKAHLRMLLGTLAGMRIGEPRGLDTETMQFGVTGGTVVVVLSPMLAESIGTATATMVRRGLPVLVIDTLPPGAAPAVADGTDPVLADLAWRMRKVEREQVLGRLSTLGCPVVTWRGPGTVDDVMHRLARRAQQPRVRAR
ncbi:MAG: hypothetical protein JWN22_2909 [Nocardioides sp.]|jgi:uncharacterized protein (DUF58 family)|nr:hypothetical protein [Nocardioides sp.]